MKIDVMKYPSAVMEVFSMFWAEHHEIRIVGGCVRDLVMGHTPKDWDMCTPLLPEQTVALLETYGHKPFDLSNGHGTISVIINGDTIEITTLRIDEQTDGRHATVKFTSDWKADAERRDFTWNAMSADEAGNVYDYFGGMRDIAYHRINFVGDEHKRIQEDYLRILRYFRFAGRFDMYMSPESLAAIKYNLAGMSKVSGERIWMEMQKILVGPQYVLKTMDQTGVLAQIGMITR